jgi:nucleotide-binding universal stress UspA family protein
MGADAATPTRVLVAVDGSQCSETAVDLVAGLAWPEGSVVRLVAVLVPAPELPIVAPGVLMSTGDLEHRMVDELESNLAAAGERMPSPLIVEHEVVRGRAADGVIDVAQRFEPDLIVAGSRGHGTIASMLLGSVSAELVDRAACPVLVARRPQLRRVTVAHDGSPASLRALDVAATHAALWPVSFTAVSVAQPPVLWRTGIAPGVYRQVLDNYAESLAVLEREHRRLATAAAERLSAAGLECDALQRTGDPAKEILEVARANDSDLIITGSRGHTGVARLILGSVARNVLLHATASVLVVHPEEGPAAVG